jgi:hypothetical protein
MPTTIESRRSGPKFEAGEDATSDEHDGTDGGDAGGPRSGSRNRRIIRREAPRWT